MVSKISNREFKEVQVYRPQLRLTELETLEKHWSQPNTTSNRSKGSDNQVGTDDDRRGGLFTMEEQNPDGKRYKE